MTAHPLTTTARPIDTLALMSALLLCLLVIDGTAAPNHPSRRPSARKPQVHKAMPVDETIHTVPTSLTLQSAYRIAKINSPELRNARHEVQQFLNNTKELKTGYLPKIIIDVKVPEWTDEEDERRPITRFEHSESQGSIALNQFLPTNTEVSLSASRELTSYDRRLEKLDFTIAQELMRKNTLTRDLRISRRRAELSLFSEQSILRNFVHEVRTAYYNHLERSQIANRNKKRSKEEAELQDKNERQYNSGIIAEYNVLDYRADYNRFLRRQLNDEAAALRARNDLFFALKLTTPTTPIEIADVDPAPYIAIPWDVADMLQAAMQENADIASLRFAIFQSETNIDYFWNDYAPSLKLYASGISRRDQTLVTNQEFDSSEYRFGVRLSWSLLGDQAGAYFRELSEKQELAINRTKLDERFAFYKNKIANDLIELERLKNTYRLNQDNVAISTREYALSLLRFETGTISSWDMIRTKNRHFQAQDSLISAKYSFLRHVSAMLRDYPNHPLSTQP